MARGLLAVVALAVVAGACAATVTVEPGSGNQGGEGAGVNATGAPGRGGHGGLGGADFSMGGSGPGVGGCEALGDCWSCATCSFEGECADDWDACMASSECVEFLGCVQHCAGTDAPIPVPLDCIHDCGLDNDIGERLYEFAADCVFCSECPASCPGPWSCTVA